MDLRTPKNVSFECQRCARCCGDTSHRGRNVLLLDSEVERISKQTGVSSLSFAAKASSNGIYRYKMKKKSGKCVFLDGKACRIYELRPVICRFYPFSMRKKNGSYVFEFAEDCPGIGMGCAVTEDQFERMAEKASKAVGSGAS